MSEKHIHKLDTIELYRITRVQPKYVGTAGDKAILGRACECGKSQAFEYGSYERMKSLKKDMERAIWVKKPLAPIKKDR